MKRRKRTWQEIVTDQPNPTLSVPAKADDFEDGLSENAIRWPLRVQRVGLAVTGLVLLLGAVGIVYMSWAMTGIFGTVFGLLPGLFGYGLLRKAFLLAPSKSDQQ